MRDLGENAGVTSGGASPLAPADQPYQRRVRIPCVGAATVASACPLVPVRGILKANHRVYNVLVQVSLVVDGEAVVVA